MLEVIYLALSAIRNLKVSKAKKEVLLGKIALQVRYPIFQTLVLLPLERLMGVVVEVEELLIPMIRSSAMASPALEEAEERLAGLDLKMLGAEVEAEEELKDCLIVVSLEEQPEAAVAAPTTVKMCLLLEEAEEALMVCHLLSSMWVAEEEVFPKLCCLDLASELVWEVVS